MIATKRQRRTTTTSRPRKAWLALGVGVALAAAAAIVSAEPLQAQEQREAALAATQRDLAPATTPSWAARHDDHGDEGEEEDEALDHESSYSFLPSASAPSSPSTPTTESHDHEHGNEDVHHSDAHEGMHHPDDHSHSHDHTHAPQPHIPAPEQVGEAPVPIPYIASSGGHTHSHSNAPPEEMLNETKLLLSKGPEPLSYVEWDMGYGMGSEDALRRFVSSAYLDGHSDSESDVMGVVGSRYRRLLDERDGAVHAAIQQDILARVGTAEAPLQPARHGWLILLHIVGACLSCFILLPLTLFLRAASSSLAPLSALVYLGSLMASMLVSELYKALTPRLYPSNSHGKMGWAIWWLSVICLGGDVLRLGWACLQAGRSASGKVFPQRVLALFRTAIQGKHTQRSGFEGEEEEEGEKGPDSEEQRMLGDEQTIYSDGMNLFRKSNRRSSSASPPRVHFADSNGSSETLNDIHRGASRGSSADGSLSPTSTLFGNSHSRQGSMHEAFASKLASRLASSERGGDGGDDASLESWRSAARASHAPGSSTPLPPLARSRKSIVKSVFRYTHVVVARALPVLAFATTYTGLAVYTGSCRAPYQNVCLAHGIKGAIFFWYGLLTFARYLGAYADCGWAWNKRPSRETAKKRGAGWKAGMPSAEWVECLTIFTYGATNTWMERFSAKAGDPYTVKQVQHISIAVMYWFAGALGLLLETRWVRNLLSLPVALHHPSAVAVSSSRRTRQAESEQDPIVAAQTPPPSYSGSFNPFPALCVGVTGIAMAAHHQDYIYEVQIHELWGQLLAAFAVLRCVTYFLLWLRPPVSVLPSRPPTEALASFALAAGGLVFMISSEEVSFAAMRNGFGDFMAIMCVTVAFMCFVFALIAGLMLAKAWAVQRELHRSRRGVEDSYERRYEPRPMQRKAEAPAEAQAEPVFVLGDDGEEELAVRTLMASPDNLA